MLCQNTLSNSNLGRKGLFHLIACSPSLKEVRAGTQGRRNSCRGHGRVLLTCGSTFCFFPWVFKQCYTLGWKDEAEPRKGEVYRIPVRLGVLGKEDLGVF